MYIFNYYSLMEVLGRHDPRIHFAIIGNGPTTERDREEMEAADVVVRFNNWGSRSGLREQQPHITGRCDIVFLSGDVHTTNIGNGSDISMPRMAVQVIPYPHNRKNIRKNMEEFYPDAMHCIMNPYVYGDCCEAINIPHDGLKHPGMPSVGFAALYSLAQLELRICNFYVGGFTWNYSREHNTIGGHPFDNQPPVLNHRYYDEAKWVRSHLVRRNNWSFSLVCHKTLEAFKDI